MGSSMVSIYCFINLDTYFMLYSISSNADRMHCYDIRTHVQDDIKF